MALCEQKHLEVVKKYVGKKIRLQYYIENNYRIDGTPQYNRILYVNGVLVYNQWLNYNRDLMNEHQALYWFGRDIGQFTKRANYYGCCDFDMNFVVTDKLIKLVEQEIN